MGKARVDADLCSTCYCWDTVMQPEGTRLCMQIRAAILALDPSFFTDFDTQCKEKGWRFTDGKSSVDDEEFLQSLIELLESATSSADVGITAALWVRKLAKFRDEAQEIMPHWKRRNKVYSELQSDLRCEEDYMIFGWSDWMENFNTPRGPKAVEEVWRAQARIQTSVHCCIFWGARIGRDPLAVVFLGRVTDKGPYYTAMVLERSLDLLGERGIMQETIRATLWKDNAVSYKSAVSMAFTSYYWPQKYGIHTCNGGIHVPDGNFQLHDKLNIH